MERTVNAMEESPDRGITTKVCKDYTIEDAIVFLEKAMKAIKPVTINSSGRKLSRCCAWPHRIYNRANQGNQERDCREGKNGGKGFKIWVLEKFKS